MPCPSIHPILYVVLRQSYPDCHHPGSAMQVPARRRTLQGLPSPSQPLVATPPLPDRCQARHPPPLDDTIPATLMYATLTLWTISLSAAMSLAAWSECSTQVYQRCSSIVQPHPPVSVFSNQPPASQYPHRSPQVGEWTFDTMTCSLHEDITRSGRRHRSTHTDPHHARFAPSSRVPTTHGPH